MFGPFALWAQQNNLPLSGNVDQEILLGAVSTQIAGVPEIEREVVTEVASYGNQLGTILQAVEALAREAKIDVENVPELKAMVDLQARIEETKTRRRDALRQRAELALERLREADEGAWRRLRQLD